MLTAARGGAPIGRAQRTPMSAYGRSMRYTPAGTRSGASVSIGAPHAVAGRAPLAFSPTPTQPPPGTYDPVLDANLRGAQRGYGDTLADYAPLDGSLGTPGVKTQRAYDDYQLARGETLRTGAESLATILRNRARMEQDYGTREQQAQHDADLRQQDTTRSFTNLAGRQQEELGAANGLDSGAALASAQVRGANENLAQGRIADALNTLLGNLHTAQGRAEQDSGGAERELTGGVGQLGITFDVNGNPQLTGTPTAGALGRSLGQEDLGYTRSADDAATQLARARRELGSYTADTQREEAYQAQQGGYVGPKPPSNEFSDEKGPYRIIVHGGEALKVRPNGQVESSRPAASRKAATSAKAPAPARRATPGGPRPRNVTPSRVRVPGRGTRR